MSHREQFMYDVRVRDRFVNEGTLSKADVDKHLASLVDRADACEELELEQPALASEQEEVVAAPEAAPVAQASPALGGFGAAPARAAIPAIAEPSQQAPVPTPNAPAEPVPAIAQEPQPPPGPAAPADPNAPASVPPPTAAVDADWGDS